MRRRLAAHRQLGFCLQNPLAAILIRAITLGSRVIKEQFKNKRYVSMCTKLALVRAE